MKPRLELVPHSPRQSFRCFHRREPYLEFEWHQHAEYELTWIVNSRGRRFVGDSIEEYQPGELVLLGPHLPHTWASTVPTGGSTEHHAVVVQFDDAWITHMLAHCPELHGIQQLLAASRQGLHFAPAQAAAVTGRLNALVDHEGPARIIELLAIFDTLAQPPHPQPLVSNGYLARSRSSDARAQRALDYIRTHTDEPIRQSDVAAHVGMTPAAFSRFFRRATGRSFTEYVHELRVGHACRLLIESDTAITQACFDAGFGNIANFNRVFRRLKGMTPREFRTRFARPTEAA